MALRSEARPRFPGTWSFPGGGVEEGETLAAALERELDEEIGVIPTQFFLFDQLSEFEPISSQTVDFHLFVVTNWTGVVENLGAEHSELKWMPLQSAAALPKLALAEYSRIFAKLEACEKG